MMNKVDKNLSEFQNLIILFFIFKQTLLESILIFSVFKLISELKYIFKFKV